MSAEIEQAVLDHALVHPCHGAVRVEQELRLKGVQVSAGGIRGVWQRHGLLTKHERLLRLEKATAERKIELTEEQTGLLERFSPEFRERHIEAPHTGSLFAVDTFFVGTHQIRALLLQGATSRFGDDTDSDTFPRLNYRDTCLLPNPRQIRLHLEESMQSRECP